MSERDVAAPRIVLQDLVRDKNNKNNFKDKKNRPKLKIKVKIKRGTKCVSIFGPKTMTKNKHRNMTG
jgi:hypothetical protein